MSRKEKAVFPPSMIHTSKVFASWYAVPGPPGESVENVASGVDQAGGGSTASMSMGSMTDLHQNFFSPEAPDITQMLKLARNAKKLSLWCATLHKRLFRWSNSAREWERIKVWPRSIVNPLRTAELEVLYVAANDQSEVWCIASNYKIYRRPSEIRAPTFIKNEGDESAKVDLSLSSDDPEDTALPKKPVTERNEVWERVRIGFIPARSICFAGSTALIVDINDMVYKVTANPLVQSSSSSSSSSPSKTRQSSSGTETQESNISFIQERINRAILSTVNEEVQNESLYSSDSGSVPLPLPASLNESQNFISQSGSQLQNATAVYEPYKCEKVSDLLIRSIAASTNGDLWGITLAEKLTHAEYNLATPSQDASFTAFENNSSSSSIDLESLVWRQRDLPNFDLYSAEPNTRPIISVAASEGLTCCVDCDGRMYIRNRLPFFGRMTTREFKEKDTVADLEDEFEIVDEDAEVEGEVYDGQFGKINSKRQDVNLFFNPHLTQYFCGPDLSPEQLASIKQMRASSVSMNGNGSIWALSMDRDFLYVIKPRLLQLLTVSEFVKVQRDKKNNKDLSIFRPIGPPGFSILGDIAENTFLDYPLTFNFDIPSSTVPLLIREDKAICHEIDEAFLHSHNALMNLLDPPLLASPIDYELVASTEAEGAPGGYALYRPVAPKHYQRMGDIWFSDRTKKPSSDTIGTTVSCVHHSVLDRGAFVRFPDSENGSLFGKPGAFSLWVPRPHSENTLSPYCFLVTSPPKNLNFPPTSSFFSIKL